MSPCPIPQPRCSFRGKDDENRVSPIRRASQRWAQEQWLNTGIHCKKKKKSCIARGFLSHNRSQSHPKARALAKNLDYQHCEMRPPARVSRPLVKTNQSTERIAREKNQIPRALSMRHSPDERFPASNMTHTQKDTASQWQP